VEARLAAEHILGEARAAADRMAQEARERASSEAAQARREAEEQAQASLAGRWLALRDAERASLERSGGRVLQLASVLAERLLRPSLALEPARVAELARQVIAEAGGARRAVVDAHPHDADALKTHLKAAALGVQSIEIREDASLSRGDLRLHTDLGTI